MLVTSPCATCCLSPLSELYSEVVLVELLLSDRLIQFDWDDDGSDHVPLASKDLLPVAWLAALYPNQAGGPYRGGRVWYRSRHFVDVVAGVVAR
jgi:hypothetical protein